jgi:hypothetical protein
MATESACGGDHEWELRGVSFDLGASGTQTFECRRCTAVMTTEQPTSVPHPEPPEAP